MSEHLQQPKDWLQKPFKSFEQSLTHQNGYRPTNNKQISDCPSSMCTHNKRIRHSWTGDHTDTIVRHWPFSPCKALLRARWWSPLLASSRSPLWGRKTFIGWMLNNSPINLPALNRTVHIENCSLTFISWMLSNFPTHFQLWTGQHLLGNLFIKIHRLNATSFELDRACLENCSFTYIRRMLSNSPTNFQILTISSVGELFISPLHRYSKLEVLQLCQISTCWFTT